MLFLNWPQFTALPQNKNLTVEQIRQRYMWYLTEQTAIFENQATTANSTSAGGSGKSVEPPALFQYSVIGGAFEDLLTTTLAGWKLNGVFIDQNGTQDYSVIEALGYNATTSSAVGNDQQVYLWILSADNPRTVEVYDATNNITTTQSFEVVSDQITLELVSDVITLTENNLSLVQIQNIILPNSSVISFSNVGLAINDPTMGTVFNSFIQNVFGPQASGSLNLDGQDLSCTLQNTYFNTEASISITIKDGGSEQILTFGGK